MLSFSLSFRAGKCNINLKLKSFRSWNGSALRTSLTARMYVIFLHLTYFISDMKDEKNSSLKIFGKFRIIRSVLRFRMSSRAKAGSIAPLISAEKIPCTKDSSPKCKQWKSMFQLASLKKAFGRLNMHIGQPTNKGTISAIHSHQWQQLIRGMLEGSLSLRTFMGTIVSIYAGFILNHLSKNAFYPLCLRSLANASILQFVCYLVLAVVLNRFVTVKKGNLSKMFGKLFQ